MSKQKHDIGRRKRALASVPAAPKSGPDQYQELARGLVRRELAPRTILGQVYLKPAELEALRSRRAAERSTPALRAA
jgi:hypothetical protein